MVYFFIIIAVIIVVRNLFSFQANKNINQDKSSHINRFDNEIQDADFEEID